MDLAWLDELDLDPSNPWLKMGTRSLGARPWLVVDDLAEVELAERARLLDERRDEVFVTSPAAMAASAEVLRLVQDSVGDASADAAVDPLEQAGRLAQEDLVLMHWRDGAWRLDAACLCFPSRWKLADKVGRPMLDIHGPVAGYPDELSEKVNTMMSRLGDRPVWRRNWFVHPNPALFQPVRDVDPVIPAERCLDELYVRSERQTLRRLDADGWVLFTIRIQHCPLRALVDARGDAFASYLRAAPEDAITHRGIKPEQAIILRGRP